MLMTSDKIVIAVLCVTIAAPFVYEQYQAYRERQEQANKAAAEKEQAMLRFCDRRYRSDLAVARCVEQLRKEQ